MVTEKTAYDLFDFFSTTKVLPGYNEKEQRAPHYVRQTKFDYDNQTVTLVFINRATRKEELEYQAHYHGDRKVLLSTINCKNRNNMGLWHLLNKELIEFGFQEITPPSIISENKMDENKI